MDRRINKMTIFNSWTYFMGAHRAEEECRNSPTNVVVAIVFAFAGIEAFVNELIHMADQWQGESEDTDTVVAFAEMATELERDHASTVSKLQVLGLVFSGKPFLRGAGFLKEVVLLSRLRNALVHAKPAVVYFGNEGPHVGAKAIESILHQLSDRGLIPDSKQNQSNWVDKICTPEVAHWANDVVVGVVKEVSGLLPECGMLSFVNQVQTGLNGLKRTA